MSRIAGLYAAALDTLLEPARLARVLDNERRTGAGALTLPELFGQLEEAAFGDAAVREPSGEPSADRRALQRLLVDRFADLALAPPAKAPPEASQVAARSLRKISERVVARLVGGRLDGYGEAHFEDLARRIHRTLEAGVQLSAGG